MHKVSSAEHYNLAIRVLNLFLAGNREPLWEAFAEHRAIARYAEGESFFMALADLAITPAEILAAAAETATFNVKKRIVQHQNATIDIIGSILGSAPGDIRDILTGALVQGHSDSAVKLSVLSGFKNGREVPKLVTLCRPQSREVTSQLKTEFHNRFNFSISSESLVDGVIYHLKLDGATPERGFIQDCLRTLIESEGDSMAKSLITLINKRGAYKEELEMVGRSSLPEASTWAQSLLSKRGA